MAANVRNNAEIARDRRIIAHWYLTEGLSQPEIAARLNEREDVSYTLSQQMVSYDLRQLIDDWLTDARADVAQAKAQELAKINNLELEYWAAWERSCLDAETIRQEGEKPKEGESPKANKVVKTIKGQAGDPRFLAGVQWCIERRCKILGIDAPEKKELSGPDGGPIQTENVGEPTSAEHARAMVSLLEAFRTELLRPDRHGEGAVDATEPATGSSDVLPGG